MVRSRILGMIRAGIVESQTVVVAVIPLHQPTEDCGGGMEALCCYGSEKQARLVKTVFFLEPATSGGLEDV